MSTSGPSLALDFTICEIPFSFRGSWLDLSPVTAMHTTSEAIHLVSHRNGMHAVLRLEPVRGDEVVDAAWRARTASFRWKADSGAVEAAFENPDTVRLRGDGLGLRIGDAAGALTPFTGVYLFVDPVDSAPTFTSYETGRRYRITVLKGALEVEGDEALGEAPRAVVLGADGLPWEAALEEVSASAAAYEPGPGFDAVVDASARALGEYVDAVAPWRDERTPAAELAAYVLWSATVAPEGFLGRESVLMSKHWMDKVWSWDHCFNALALAPGLTDLAVDQFLAPFDHQDATGALPDSVAHSEVLYNYVKPPIHGWALRRLRATAGRDLTTAELEEIHRRLTGWSRFWLDRRRRPGHELPYYQHGNDSGWDNSTTFDVERVIEAPDLAAFLVLQLEVLADLSRELGQQDQEWTLAREQVLRALLEQLWTGEEFVARGARSARASTSTSLLNLLPLVLGDRLPEEVRSSMVAHLLDHLTDFGPATEPVGSHHYEADGYWRGPIWAPSTALIEDGLRASGFAELADIVSARFRALCEGGGFAENFDASTGAGLRDRAYTWTAAVYLTLAADHVRRNPLPPAGVPAGRKTVC